MVHPRRRHELTSTVDSVVGSCLLSQFLQKVFSTKDLDSCDPLEIVYVENDHAINIVQCNTFTVSNTDNVLVNYLERGLSGKVQIYSVCLGIVSPTGQFKSDQLLGEIGMPLRFE